MGLSSMPTPTEGVLTVLVVNTVMSVAILKQILNSILQLVGIRAAAAADEGSEGQNAPEQTMKERFRARFRPAMFGRRRQGADCRVCLARFEAESVVNRLPCGHVFHKACVERWLDYQHATCPLCRSQLLPPAADDAAAACSPWF